MLMLVDKCLILRNKIMFVNVLGYNELEKSPAWNKYAKSSTCCATGTCSHAASPMEFKYNATKQDVTVNYDFCKEAQLVPKL